MEYTWISASAEHWADRRRKASFSLRSFEWLDLIDRLQCYCNDRKNASLKWHLHSMIDGFLSSNRLKTLPPEFNHIKKCSRTEKRQLGRRMASLVFIGSHQYDMCSPFDKWEVGKESERRKTRNLSPRDKDCQRRSSIFHQRLAHAFT